MQLAILLFRFISIAVKVIDIKRASADANLVKQVQREKQALESVTPHDHIVKYFQSCKDATNLYFVLEYVSHGELFQYIHNGLSESRSWYITEQVSSALTHLHQQKWIHRDIKANNVGIRSTGDCVLYDFGWSKCLSGPLFTNTRLGLGHYCSPEVVDGKPHSFSTDWWSLGVLVSEMLDGSPPFGYRSETLASDISSGHFLLSNGSYEVKSFVTSLLRIDPEQRLDSLSVWLHPWLQRRNQTSVEEARSFFKFHTPENLNVTSKFKNW